jgi:hypothetical protein
MTAATACKLLSQRVTKHTNSGQIFFGLIENSPCSVRHAHAMLRHGAQHCVFHTLKALSTWGRELPNLPACLFF